MGNGAKIGLVGVLAAIVLVVAIWDRSNEPQLSDPGLGEVAKAPDTLTNDLPVVRRELGEPSGEDRLVGEIDHTGPLSVTGRNGAENGIEGVSAIAPPAVANNGQEQPSAPPQGAQAAATDGASATDLPETGVEHERTEPTPQVTQAREPSESSAGGAAGSGGAHTTYRVAPGDTLSKIAKRFYGDARRYYPIIKANRDRLPNPDVLPLGVELRIPKLDTHTARAASRSQTTTPSTRSSVKTYVVQPGDTLYRIAKRLLGSGKRYHAIYEANRNQMRSPNDLRVGMRIVIPR